MEYITRNIKKYIKHINGKQFIDVVTTRKLYLWYGPHGTLGPTFGYGPLAWALGTLGPLKKYDILKKPV